jgi:hypothetical protein
MTVLGSVDIADTYDTCSYFTSSGYYNGELFLHRFFTLLTSIRV